VRVQDLVIVRTRPCAAGAHPLAVFRVGMIPVRHGDAERAAGAEKLEAMRDAGARRGVVEMLPHVLRAKRGDGPGLPVAPEFSAPREVEPVLLGARPAVEFRGTGSDQDAPRRGNPAEHRALHERQRGTAANEPRAEICKTTAEIEIHHCSRRQVPRTSTAPSPAGACGIFPPPKKLPAITCNSAAFLSSSSAARWRKCG
jgi:hypothetical protein